MSRSSRKKRGGGGGGIPSSSKASSSSSSSPRLSVSSSDYKLFMADLSQVCDGRTLLPKTPYNARDERAAKGRKACQEATAAIDKLRAEIGLGSLREYYRPARRKAGGAGTTGKGTRTRRPFDDHPHPADMGGGGGGKAYRGKGNRDSLSRKGSIGDASHASSKEKKKEASSPTTTSERRGSIDYSAISSLFNTRAGKETPTPRRGSTGDASSNSNVRASDPGATVQAPRRSASLTVRGTRSRSSDARGGEGPARAVLRSRSSDALLAAAEQTSSSSSRPTIQGEKESSERSLDLGSVEPGKASRRASNSSDLSMVTTSSESAGKAPRRASLATTESTESTESTDPVSSPTASATSGPGGDEGDPAEAAPVATVAPPRPSRRSSAPGEFGPGPHRRPFRSPSADSRCSSSRCSSLGDGSCHSAASLKSCPEGTTASVSTGSSSRRSTSCERSVASTPALPTTSRGAAAGRGGGTPSYRRASSLPDVPAGTTGDRPRAVLRRKYRPRHHSASLNKRVEGIIRPSRYSMSPNDDLDSEVNAIVDAIGGSGHGHGNNKDAGSSPGASPSVASAKPPCRRESLPGSRRASKDSLCSLTSTEQSSFSQLGYNGGGGGHDSWIPTGVDFSANMEVYIYERK